MSEANSIDALNRLVVLHHRSLPTYLTYASPTWNRGDDHARETLETMAAQHRDLVDRLGTLITERDGAVDYGHYPIHFTGYHDLSFDFLLGRVIERQQREVGLIEAAVTALEGDPRAKELAQEALGAAKGHLESLDELRRA